MLTKTGRLSTNIFGGKAPIIIGGSVIQREGSLEVEGNVKIGGGIDTHGVVTLKSVENRQVVIGGKSSINGVTWTKGQVKIE
jgi:hypothetical protein